MDWPLMWGLGALSFGLRRVGILRFPSRINRECRLAASPSPAYRKNHNYAVSIVLEKWGDPSQEPRPWKPVKDGAPTALLTLRWFGTMVVLSNGLSTQELDGAGCASLLF